MPEIDYVNYQKEILKLYCTNIKFSTRYGSLIKADYFDSNILKIIFGVMSSYVSAYSQVLDKSQLLIEMASIVESRGYSSEIEKSINKEISDIYNTNINSEQYIINQFLEFVRFQEVKNAILQSANILADSRDYDKVFKLIENAVAVGGDSKEGLCWGNVLDVIDTIKEKYKKTNLVKTGFESFDNLFLGGFAKKEVHTISAPPKSGKSTLAVNIGINVLRQGKNVFHITLEMPDEEIMYKYLIRASRTSYREILSLSKEDIKNKIRSFSKMNPNLFINYWPEKSINTLTIRSWISRVMIDKGVKPDFVIIDYDDCLIPTSGRKEDMYNESGDIYSDLIKLAVYFDVPILTFSQPNKASWNKIKEEGLIYSEDLAHSARKSHRATSISSMNFAQGANRGILYVDRTRRGIDGVEIPLVRDLSKALIKEAKDDVYQNNGLEII